MYMLSRLKINHGVSRVLPALIVIVAVASNAFCDTVTKVSDRPVFWKIEAAVSGGPIIGGNSFIKGENPINKRARASLEGDIRGAFCFNPESPKGMLYKGLYQGIGVKRQDFFSRLFGTPWSVYVFQGYPIKHFNDRLWLGYEWEFGVAFDWKYFKTNTAAVSTSATAHIGLKLNLNQQLSSRWILSYGIGFHHYSNGNTSFANNGVNTGGVSVGVSYVFNKIKEKEDSSGAREYAEVADRKKWIGDILLYGAWRKRTADVWINQQIWPGTYAVAGIEGSLFRKFNRWIAAGPAIDLLYDASAGLDPYWIPGTLGGDIRHSHVPFGKHISAGISAHCEFSMPIFTINAGVGCDIVCPVGNGRFFQSLSLKTFITDFLYLNVGYRLTGFKDSQHLMLGLGVRI